MKKIFDERIVSESRKQHSIGFILLYFGLLIDLLYRQFIRVQPIEEIWDLLLLFFGVSFYMVGKKAFAGFYVHKSKKTLVISSLVTSTVFIAVQYFIFGQNELSAIIIGTITFFIAFMGINLLMRYISKRKNDKLLEE